MKFGKLLVALGPVAAISLGLCTAQVSAAELVSNGGFESGDFTSWSPSGNTGFTGVANSPVDAHTGSNFAFFGPVGSIGAITQTLATVAGQTYNISFWLNAFGDQPSSFGATWGGANLVSLSNPATRGWTQFNFSALASSNSTALSLSFRDDPSYIYLDDVSVTNAVGGAVPEPSTWAMLLVGFFAVGGFIRSRRRVSNASVSYA